MDLRALCALCVQYARAHITKHKVNKIFWVLQQVACFYVIKHVTNCILRHKDYKQGKNMPELTLLRLRLTTDLPPTYPRHSPVYPARNWYG